MKKRRHIQKCAMDGTIYGKRRSTGKKVSPAHNHPDKDDLLRVYNKFYKNQAAALYRAINRTR